MMRTIDSIIIHCSDSPWGCARVIDDWHKQRGFKRELGALLHSQQPALCSIGYHYVIGNGKPRPGMGDAREVQSDGLIEIGRDEAEVGSHALGSNDTSIGICCVGKQRHFTERQIAALIGLVAGLCVRYQIPSDRVLGHRETPIELAKGPAAKSCPELPMTELRHAVQRTVGVLSAIQIVT